MYNPKPESYYEDIYFTLSRVADAYFAFAKTNETFFRVMLANFSMPPSSTVFKIAEKYHFTQFEVINSMFQNMAKAHGNLKGKSKTLTWSFLGTINSYISLYFASSAKQNNAIQLNDKAIKEIVHQFMHGIYA